MERVIDKATGRFIPKGNNFEIRGDLVYCYSKEGDLLFYTDDMRVLNYNWSKAAKGYSATSYKGRQIFIHRFVSNPEEHELVDHINRNKKDNRRCNLRNTNKSVNAFNCNVRKNNTSGVTGVWYRKDIKRWAAEIKADYKKICLGTFKKFEDAVRARKAAERQYYGT